MISPRHPTNSPVLALALAAVGALLGSSDATANSYGYVSQNTALQYRPGTSAPDPQWMTWSYATGADWTASAAGFGIGYGDGDDQTVLTDMQSSYVTVYVRSTFHVGAELPGLTFLELVARFDDGFVAYLNGVEVARSGLGTGAVAWDDTSSGHEVTDGEVSYVLDPSLLISGDNVFAVEVHNASLGSSDLSFIPMLWAYDSPPPNAEITLGPYLQQVGRRSALIVWETDLPAPSVVSYGPSETTLPDTVEDLVDKTRHVLLFEGLVPGEPTYYRVQSARIPSPVGQIWPETDAAQPFKFLIYGDTRSNHGDHASVVAGMVDEVPSFTIHTGDLVGDGENESDWAWFFDIEANLLRSVALYPALGNHEADGVRYLDLFELPESSPGVENFYALRYGTVGIAMLDLYLSSDGPGSNQYVWLENTLAGWAANPQVRIKLVALHHGPYDSGPHGSHMNVRQDLVPLFETYGVDAVFAGHDHTYERSTVNGVKYVVTGGGGAPLYSASGDWWTQYTEASLHYVRVEVEGPRASFVAVRDDGSVLDQFTVGTGLNECTTPAACAAQSPGACLPDEDGAWACVHGGCVWNCTLHIPEPDAGVDAGMDAGMDAGTPPVTDAGPDAATVADAGSPPPRVQGGCACRSTGGPSPLPLLLLVSVLGWVWRRRRHR